MENKKKIIIVISIILIYFLIVLIIVGVDELKNKFYHFDVIISPSTYLRYEDGLWKDVTENHSQLLGKSYNVYSEHKFQFQGILQYTLEKWYAFDNKNKPLSIPDDFFAYSGNQAIDVVQYNMEKMSSNEIDEAKKILKENNIMFAPTFLQYEKSSIDLDNDEVKENIYIVSNALGMDEQETYFSIAYIEDSGKIQVLVSDISENMYKIPLLHIREIIDYNKDKKYELIFEKIYFDHIGTCHEIFEYEEEEFKSIKSCELIEREEEE